MEKLFEDFGWPHVVPLLNGAVFTIILCSLSIIFGSILGAIFGFMSTSDIKLLQFISKIYINVIRGMPLLLILFFIYFGLPIVFPGMDLSKNLTAIVALSIYAGAYIAEILRGGILAIQKGQLEAADALGLSYLQRTIFIIFPQVMKIITPAIIGFLIALIKDSSLVSVIGFIDLTRAGKNVSNLTLNPILTFSIVALFYFVICFALSRISNYFEKRFSHFT